MPLKKSIFLQAAIIEFLLVKNDKSFAKSTKSGVYTTNLSPLANISLANYTSLKG
jgi:hypothetical protein